MSKIALVLLLIVSSLTAEMVEINDSQFSVDLTSSQIDNFVLQYTVGNFHRDAVKIDGQTYYQISLEKEPVSFDRGAPALPFITRSLIIPDNALMQVSVLNSEYFEFNLPVLPSKGILSRQIDPATVPYSFSEVYQQDSFYPSQLAELGDPYIMRDFRGITVKVQPFRYNPVTGILRVYTDLVLEVKAVGIDSRNVKLRTNDRRNNFFSEIYSNHFLNYDDVRYTTVEEQGRMIVICYPDFTDAIAPFVAWKNQKGLHCQLYTTDDTGTTATAIKSFIQDQYDLDDGLTFVQIVGDAPQIPPYNTDQDPSYSLLEGSDTYPEIFVGRFSGTTDAHIETQVERTINYERDITAGTWLPEGLGIASAQGTGDDSEYDDEHMDNIRDKLLAYTYTAVDQEYDSNGGSVSGAMNTLNSGVSIVNYCGHGSTYGWANGAPLSTTNVAALENDNKLPFIFSVACVVGEFMTTTCFAETWLRATNGTTDLPTGAIAFYGSTINQSWAPPMRGQDHINDLLVGLNYSHNPPDALDQKFTFGGLAFNGSCNMMDVYGSSGENEFEHWTIFGDASVIVRTMQPETMSISHNYNIPTGTSTFDVNTDTQDALVCLYDGSSIIGSGYTDPSGDITLTLDPIPDTPQDLTLTVTAYNKVTSVETVSVISASGPYVTIDSYSVSSGGDDLIEPNETALLSFTLANQGTDIANNTNMILSETDPYITLTDATQSFGSIANGSTATQSNAYSFSVAPDIPDGHVISLGCAVNCDESSWNYQVDLTAAGPVLIIDGSTVSSGGDDLIEPDETALLSVTLQNDGGSTANNVGMTLTESDSYISLVDDSQSFGNISSLGSSTENDAFSFTVGSGIPDQHEIILNCQITSDENTWNHQISLSAHNPPAITYSPGSFDQTLEADETASQMLDVGNSGGAELDYFITCTDESRHEVFSNDHLTRNYCSASSYTCDEYISRVQVGSIDNSSVCENYGDFTSLSTDITIGVDHNIIVTIAEPYSGDDGGLWIDWNQDEDFYDANEEITTSWGGSGPYTETITPPETALPGPTRMRIRLTWNQTPAPCGSSNYGEVEDYTINVLSQGPDWLTLNDGSSASGSIPMNDPDDEIEVGFNSDGLDSGTYNANINIESNDPEQSSVAIPVSLTIVTAPSTPANFYLEIVGTEITLSWDAVAGANSYKIYSSDSPNGPFDLVEIVSSELTSRSYLMSDSKQFFRIVASTDTVPE